MHIVSNWTHNDLPMHTIYQKLAYSRKPLRVCQSRGITSSQTLPLCLKPNNGENKTTIGEAICSLIKIYCIGPLLLSLDENSVISCLRDGEKILLKWHFGRDSISVNKDLFVLLNFNDKKLRLFLFTQRLLWNFFFVVANINYFVIYRRI